MFFSKLLGDLSSNKNPSVGTKLEGLLLNSDSDSGEYLTRFIVNFKSSGVTRVQLRLWLLLLFRWS